MKEKIFSVLKTIWKHKIVAMIIVILVFAFGYFGYNKNSDKQTSGEIQTAEIEKGDISITVTGSGQVYAENQVDLLWLCQQRA